MMALKWGKYFKRMKQLWIACAVFGILFAVLFSIRLNIFDRYLKRTKPAVTVSKTASPSRDVWMNIFQNKRKIGFSHNTFSSIKDGYRLSETLHMRINTMGLIQDIILKTGGELNSDFTLSSFEFEINSGRFKFRALGNLKGEQLFVKTFSMGSSGQLDVKIDGPVYLTSSIFDTVKAMGLIPGSEHRFKVFDPATMGTENIIVRSIGKEKIRIMDVEINAHKMDIEFKGIKQLAWVDENGEVLQESGLLGIRLIKTTRGDALFGLPVKSSQDLTRVASVESNVIIRNPERLVLLAVEISGIDFNNVRLSDGRQKLRNNILTIRKEFVPRPFSGIEMNEIPENEKIYLKPTLFIQSDHPKIRRLAEKIVKPGDAPVVKAGKIIAWIGKTIRKRPVLSLPDALSTLENKVGDCNEHAVLMAALARAAGIPARVESGLVYLNGRFYYHAWNLLYIGKWITADSLFRQMPADVTHIRFAGGTQKQQLDLMNIIGKIKLKVIRQK